MAAPYFQMPLNFNADALALPSDQLHLGLQSSPPSSNSYIGSPANVGNLSHPSSMAGAQPQPQSQPPRTVSGGGSGGGNRKGTSAERRATHNAIERARRESLNGRFLQLAASLPAIADVRRPSKSLIVNKSLDFVHTSLSHEALYRKRLDSLRSENEALREQLNEFRKQAGLDPLPAPVVDELPLPLSEMGDKKRSGSLSGNAAGAGDLGEYDDDDGLNAGSSEGEASRTSPVVAASSNPGANGHGLPSGLTGFDHLQAAQLGQHQQHSNPMALATGLPGQGRASSTASTHSEEVGAAAQGSWNYASSSNGLGVTPSSSNFGGDFTFAATSNLLNGGGGSSSNAAGGQLSAPGFPHFAGLSQSSGSHDASTSIDPLVQPSSAPLDTYSALRGPQQTYGQYMAAFDHGHSGGQSQHPFLQHQHQQQHNLHHHNLNQQQHFFDPSPRQPTATFLTTAV
ncbi:uncharacterized protein PFL1_04954 [Pseudozyma flocculosa PF-1]|uniref:BHLH domain-containing protein n=2 Tax=Pseudozyma flocculosa TaxID=84751 RepID=A0A5C3EWC2_9BASI|nr:uncharacterized protein PFL1_04954 [Pseudozyma flocculosa PF-1]EPQ27416.1 hypothetical protein PFL1_04954 [Pseudozyma flocculosa PF-1]SPO36160.1 uncharacterized protein PSFLO_01631 [Pseudozyma flocculosa]